MDYQHILYTKDAPVLTLTLNRPEALNAISPELEHELHVALDEADADAEIRAIIVNRCRPRLFRRLRYGSKPGAAAEPARSRRYGGRRVSQNVVGQRYPERAEAHAPLAP